MFYASNFNLSYMLLAIMIGLLLGLMLTKRGKFDKEKVSGLKRKDFLDMKRKGTLIDCRSEEEFNESKMSGAKNFKGKSGAKSGAIRKDIPVFIYDKNGKRAYSIAKSYAMNGYVMIYYLEGGYQAYLNE